ncbi:MAG: hypothetical protein LUE96_08130 [Lachnospiraceae bacterium]|nr:hypothetical protein [Lachnospiraceae bacterium]
MQNDNFKYVIQDTGNVYFGRELTYTEILEREDAPFKFKSIITGHIAKDTDLNQKIYEHLITLDPDSFTYKIFEQLKLSVRVCYKKQKKGFGGRVKEKWVHEACPVKRFCGEYREQVKAQQMIIEDISISKLALMILNIV